MSYVHKDAGLLFLANPRTASRATAKALQGIGFVKIGQHHHYDQTLSINRQRLTFSTVRSIPDTLCSWRRWLRRPEASLVVVLELILNTQRGMVPGWESWTLFPHAEHSDVLLRYEQLETDLNRLLYDNGLPAVELERIE